MAVYKKTIEGLTLVMESQLIAPEVTVFMISLQGDPLKFPMVYKKELGGWIFVDKMTLLEFKERELEISKAIEEVTSA